MRRQIADGLEIPFLRRLLADRHGVGIRCRRWSEDRQVPWKSTQQRQFNRLRCGHLRVLVEVLQQVAGVLGDQVDRMILDRGYVGFAAAAAELPTDSEAL